VYIAVKSPLLLLDYWSCSTLYRFINAVRINKFFMGKRWPLLSLFDFTGIQNIERENKIIINHSHLTNNNWYRKTQADFPINDPNNVIVGFQMHTLNNALTDSIDSNKFFRLPWISISMLLSAFDIFQSYVLEILLELGSKIRPCNMHDLWDRIYFCNGKYKEMCPFYETMLVILNFPLRILP
jgi:hypothetical protein